MACAALAVTMLISASASAQNGVFIPDVQLEAPADLQPSLDECDGECERELRLRLGVDVDLELRIELAELLRDIPPPPKRRYAVPLLITAVGVGSLAASIALLTNQDTYETSTGTRVGATLFAVGGLAITSGLIALMFRVLIFHGRRAERRRALLDAGLVRW